MVRNKQRLCPTLSTDVDLPEVICFQHPSHKAGYGVVTPQNAKLQGIPASIQPNSPIWLQKEASGSKSHSWLVMEPEWALDPSPAFIPLCQTMRGKCLGVRKGFLGPFPPPPTLPCSPTSMPGALSMTDVWECIFRAVSHNQRNKGGTEELGAKSGLEGPGGKEGAKFYRVGPQLRLSFYLQGACLAGWQKRTRQKPPLPGSPWKVPTAEVSV